VNLVDLAPARTGYLEQGQGASHWQWLEEQLAQFQPDELQSRWQEMSRGLQDSNPHWGPRLWNLDPIPAVLSDADWILLEEGLTQRARLLNLLLQDAYGQQQLLKTGQLPPELYYKNPRWLAPCHGLVDSDLARLMFYAVDLIRDASGQWCVLRDRTQCAVGFGATLENRRWMARAYHEIFSRQHIQPLAPAYQALRVSLAELSQPSRGARMVMLTSTAGSPQTADDAALAHFLGCPLAEGEDLTVRGGCVYLKLLEGLQPVDVLLRRIPDHESDPLEMPPGNWPGLVALLQAVRLGNVVVTNSIGSGWLESPALGCYMARLCPSLLREPLLLPDMPARWDSQVPTRGDWVARRLEGGPPLVLPELSQQRQQLWWKQCRASEWVFQEYRPPSLFPCWYQGQLQLLPGVVRCFVVSTPQGYRILPGGVVRLRPGPGTRPLSKDLWRTGGESTPLASTPASPSAGLEQPLSRKGGDVPSRVAEQFYWFGRYLERCESLLRFARLLVQRQTLEADPQTHKDLNFLLSCREEMGSDLVAWVNGNQEDQLQALLNHLGRLGGSLRDRVSADLPRVLAAIQPHPESLESRQVLAYLETLSVPIWALVSIARESLYRGYGFRFLEIGRRLERAVMTCDLLLELHRKGPPQWGVLEVLLEVTDSGRTYRRRYSRLEWLPVLDLLLADEIHPRSMAFQLRSLEEHFSALPSPPQADIGLPPHQESLLRARAAAKLWRPPGEPPLSELAEQLRGISQGLASRYLTHLKPRFQGVARAI